MSLAELEDDLRAEVEEGLFATGGQVYVSVAGEVVADWAFGRDGVGEPVTRETLFAVYCSGKPPVALAVAGLVEEGELSLDDRLVDVVERPASEAMAAVLVEHVLSHTAGLHELDPHIYLAWPVRLRHGLWEVLAPVPDWRLGRDVAYAQVQGWYALGQVIEALTGAPAPQIVRDRVLAPVGVDGDFFVGGMSEADYKRNRPRMGVNTFLHGPSGVPILGERTQRYRCLDDLSLGTTATTRALGRLYEHLLEVWQGRSGVVASETLRRFAAPHSHGFDQVMGRECGYGLGFMTGLDDHQFGARVGRHAFGHSAYGGMTAAFCDPEVELVVAFHFNGRIDAESAIGYRRPMLIGRIYQEAVDALG